MDNATREEIARAIWFDHCDRRGWPNGLPTWDELITTDDKRLADDAEEARSNASAIEPILNRLIAEAREKALEEAAECQPNTAENPNLSAHDRGFFDAVMIYQRAIRALKTKDNPHA